KEVIIEAGESDSVVIESNENTILKITLSGTAGDALNMSIFDANNNQIGANSSLNVGTPYYTFFSPGGEVTINLNNLSTTKDIGADLAIEFIKPRDMGIITANSTQDLHVPSHNVNEDIFL